MELKSNSAVQRGQIKNFYHRCLFMPPCSGCLQTEQPLIKKKKEKQHFEVQGEKYVPLSLVVWITLTCGHAVTHKVFSLESKCRKNHTHSPANTQRWMKTNRSDYVSMFIHLWPFVSVATFWGQKKKPPSVVYSNQWFSVSKMSQCTDLSLTANTTMI